MRTLDKEKIHAFIWKAKKNNIPIKAVNAIIKTSARKYNERGWAKTTFEHLFLTIKQIKGFYV